MNPSENIDLKHIIEDLAVEQDIRDFKIDISAGSVKGDGYVGVINSAQVTGKDATGKDKSLNLIIKSAKKSEALREQAPIHKIFQVETYVYDSLFPTYKKLEEKKGLTPTRFAPKFYKGDTTDKHEYLILENLKEMGYKLHERRYPMNEEHVRLVFEQYGKLHALSFVLENEDPEKFNEVKSFLGDIWKDFMKQSDFRSSIESRYEKALESLDPVTDKEALDACKIFSDKVYDFVLSLVQTVDNNAVVLHGDCWTNNMMFKYKEGSSDKLVCVNLLDFQMARIGSPVLDLTYFFYTCSSKAVIDNFEEYRTLYYNTLKTHLRHFDLDVEKFYPYEVFQEQWKNYGKYGLLMASMLIHIMLSEQNETVDVAEAADSGVKLSEVFNYDISNINEYNNRMRDILLHFAKNKFI